MAVNYLKPGEEFTFPTDFGFTGSAQQTRQVPQQRMVQAPRRTNMGLYGQRQAAQPNRGAPVNPAPAVPGPVSPPTSTGPSVPSSAGVLTNALLPPESAGPTGQPLFPSAPSVFDPAQMPRGNPGQSIGTFNIGQGATAPSGGIDPAAQPRFNPGQAPTGPFNIGGGGVQPSGPPPGRPVLSSAAPAAAQSAASSDPTFGSINLATSPIFHFLNNSGALTNRGMRKGGPVKQIRRPRARGG